MKQRQEELQPKERIDYQSYQTGIETKVDECCNSIPGPINRTKLELKQINRFSKNGTIAAINRTKLELKRAYMVGKQFADAAINRTKLELKHALELFQISWPMTINRTKLELKPFTG